MQAYDEALSRGHAAYLDGPGGPTDSEESKGDKAERGPKPVKLSAAISAELVSMNLRVDNMLQMLAPERAAEHQMRRIAMMGDVMARGGTLKVEVVSGKNLPKMDRWGKSDPYVILEVCCTNQIFASE